MARMSIYVPDALKARMDPLSDRVNWSNVAQEAFERKLAASTLISGSEMKDVIERLRASKAEFVSQNETQGAKDGREWATTKASYADLLAFSRVELDSINGEAIYGHAFNVEMGTDKEDPEEQWFYDVDTKSYDENEYVFAYVEAVQAVWNEVSDHL